VLLRAVSVHQSVVSLYKNCLLRLSAQVVVSFLFFNCSVLVNDRILAARGCDLICVFVDRYPSLSKQFTRRWADWVRVAVCFWRLSCGALSAFALWVLACWFLNGRVKSWSSCLPGLHFQFSSEWTFFCSKRSPALTAYTSARSLCLSGNLFPCEAGGGRRHLPRRCAVWTPPAVSLAFSSWFPGSQGSSPVQTCPFFSFWIFLTWFNSDWLS